MSSLTSRRWRSRPANTGKSGAIWPGADGGTDWEPTLHARLWDAGCRAWHRSLALVMGPRASRGLARLLGRDDPARWPTARHAGMGRLCGRGTLVQLQSWLA